jgi:predicted ABC-type ATPase
LEGVSRQLIGNAVDVDHCRNGAGKSTLTRHGVVREVTGQNLIELNADDRALEIRTANPEISEATLRAARDTDAQVAQCITQGEDFLIETVLSTDKYIDDAERALSLGFQIGMVYVGLATPQDAIRRVALRVAQQGHDVPTDRIVSRWARSA